MKINLSSLKIHSKRFQTQSKKGNKSGTCTPCVSQSCSKPNAKDKYSIFTNGLSPNTDYKTTIKELRAIKNDPDISDEDKRKFLVSTDGGSYILHYVLAVDFVTLTKPKFQPANERYEILKAILELSPDDETTTAMLTTRDRYGQTPLHIVLNGDEAKLLLEHAPNDKVKEKMLCNWEGPTWDGKYPIWNLNLTPKDRLYFLEASPNNDVLRRQLTESQNVYWQSHNPLIEIFDAQTIPEVVEYAKKCNVGIKSIIGFLDEWRCEEFFKKKSNIRAQLALLQLATPEQKEYLKKRFSK